MFAISQVPKNSALSRLCLLFLAVILLITLAGCKNVLRTQGAVELLDDTGNPYSFEGATATLFPLTPSAVTPGQTRTVLATAPVPSDDGAVTLAVRRSAVRDNDLYAVEFRCPANLPDDNCTVEAPLRIVLTGAQLKAGDWKATVLTEVAFHSVAYGVAVDFSAADVLQTLGNTASWLLVVPAVGNEPGYSDLLAWNPAHTISVRRPRFLSDFTTALVNGHDNNALQVLAQQWISPVVGGLVLDDLAVDVALAGQYAYVVYPNYTATGALNIVDVSDPSRPVLSAKLDGLGSVQAVAVAGDLAYVAEDQRYLFNTQGALQIVNINDPEQPEWVARFDTPGAAYDVVVAGNFAFVAETGGWPSGFDGLQIVNISNPQAPVLAGTLPIGSGLRALALSGGQLYAVGGGGLHVIDVSNPEAPVLVNSQPLAGQGYSLLVADGYAYAGGNDGMLRIVDVSDPALPLLGSLPFEGRSNPIRRISKFDGLAYVSDSSGLHIIDVSNPMEPRRAGLLSVTSYGQEVLPNGYAYLAAGRAGLQIYDVNFIDRAPVLAGSLAVAGGASRNTAVENNIAYSPITLRATSVFDLSDPLAPQFLAEYPFTDAFLTVAPVGQYAFVGDVSFGIIRVLDISDPTAPLEMTSVFLDPTDELPGLHSLVVDGNHAYASYGYMGENEEGEYEVGGMYIVNIQDPLAPYVVAHYSAPARAGALAVSRTHAYLALSDGRINAIDIANPQTPTLLGTMTLPDPVQFIAESGDTLYLGAGSNGIHIVDAADPTELMLMATLDTPGSASVITLAEGYAYVADGISGVQVVAVDDPAAPVLVGGADTIGTVRGVFLNGGYLNAATDYGFEILKMMPAPKTAP